MQKVRATELMQPVGEEQTSAGLQEMEPGMRFLHRFLHRNREESVMEKR